MCALLNAQSPARRLLIQPTGRARYSVPATRAECNETLRAARAQASVHAARICAWLGESGVDASAGSGGSEAHVERGLGGAAGSTKLTESLEEFWAWLKRETPTAA